MKPSPIGAGVCPPILQATPIGITWLEADMAIGNALYSNITVKEGRIEQSNYTDYLVARTDITPETYTYFVENTHLPGGIGEPGVPPTAPAICNAIYAATGKRIRALPVDPQLLKA